MGLAFIGTLCSAHSVGVIQVSRSCEEKISVMLPERSVSLWRRVILQLCNYYWLKRMYVEPGVLLQQVVWAKVTTSNRSVNFVEGFRVFIDQSWTFYNHLVFLWQWHTFPGSSFSKPSSKLTDWSIFDQYYSCSFLQPTSYFNCWPIRSLGQLFLYL